jgi:hypothetical protein
MKPGPSADDRRTAAHTARRALIAVEGRATEAPYFEAIRRHLHLPTRVVTVLDSLGSSPISLVRGVIKVRDKAIAAGEFDAKGGDTAWAVFDGDEHQASDPRGFAEACRLADAKGVRVAMTNPSFELWFLLHFEEQFAPLDARAALARLKRHVPHYRKGAVLFPDPLLPLTQAAIERARRLDERARREGVPGLPNPATGVPALVEHLFALGDAS